MKFGQKALSIPNIKAGGVCVLIILLFIYSTTIAQNLTLKGRVIDKNSKLPVENVNVSVSLLKGTITDKEGNFLLKVKPGRYRIKFSHVNYKPMFVEIEQHQPGEKEMTIELIPRVIEFKPVEVEASKIEYLNYQKFMIEKIRLNYSPSIGENDVFRAISLLPGVSTVNDFSNQLFIWGGNFDHTLVSIDGIPVHNPYHLSGLFSFINSNVVETITLYPAGYPVLYDDCLSAIVDMRTSSPLRDRYSLKSNISLATASLTFSGPVPAFRDKNLGSLFISARRVYFDLILKGFTELERSPYYFYDLMGKYEIAGGKDILSLTAFVSKDVLNIFEDEYAKQHPIWGNYGLGLRWFHTFNEENNLTVNFHLSESFAVSDYENPGVFPASEKLVFDNKMLSFGIDGYWMFKFLNHRFKTGFRIKGINFDYFWLVQGVNLWAIFNIFEEESKKSSLQDVFFDYAPNPFQLRQTLWKYSLFFEGELNYEKLNLVAGVKFIDLNKNASFKISPNLSATYHLSRLLDVHFIYGRYFQFAGTIRNKVGSMFFAPFSVYLPSTDPPVADHFVIRANSLGIKPEFELSYYFKSFRNLTVSVNDESFYRKIIARAYGLNFNLKYDARWMFWNASYSLGFAREKVDGGWIPMYYEQRHSVKIFLMMKFSRKWDLSLFWTYASGLPYTPVIGRYFGPGNPAGQAEILWLNYFYGRENSKYLPDYHRLDLKFTGNFNWGKFNFKPFIQIFNVYNSARVFKYEFTYFSPTEFKKSGTFIIPSIGVEINAEF